MKVKLINVAEYDIKDGKTSDMPFETFVNLCGNVGTGEDENLPKVRLFKTMDEFRNLTNDEMKELNQDEKVRVLPNGQFFVFLKTTVNNKKKDTAVKDDAAANT